MNCEECIKHIHFPYDTVVLEMTDTLVIQICVFGGNTILKYGSNTKMCQILMKYKNIEKYPSAKI